jgi:hypothetical protein
MKETERTTVTTAMKGEKVWTDQKHQKMTAKQNSSMRTMHTWLNETTRSHQPSTAPVEAAERVRDNAARK